MNAQKFYKCQSIEYHNRTTCCKNEEKGVTGKDSMDDQTHVGKFCPPIFNFNFWSRNVLGVPLQYQACAVAIIFTFPPQCGSTVIVAIYCVYIYAADSGDRVVSHSVLLHYRCSQTRHSVIPNSYLATLLSPI